MPALSWVHYNYYPIQSFQEIRYKCYTALFISEETEDQNELFRLMLQTSHRSSGVDARVSESRFKVLSPFILPFNKTMSAMGEG